MAGFLTLWRELWYIGEENPKFLRIPMSAPSIFFASGLFRAPSIKAFATCTAIVAGALFAPTGPANAAFTCNLVSGVLEACTGNTLLDKQFSNFQTNYTGNGVITGETTPLLATDPAAPTFFDINFDFTPNLDTEGINYFLSYDVTIINPFNGKNYEFLGARIQQTVNGFEPDSLYTASVSPGFSPPTVLTLEDAASPSEIAFWGPGVTSISVRQDFTINPTGSDASFDDISINLAQREVTEVPGPLPILGSAIAFGFSRKLRRRIKKAA
jgi:hypothetical protein